MKTGRSLTELAVELDRQVATKKDFKADTRALAFHSNGDSVLTMSEVGDFPVGNIAHEQIAERLQIPKRYYDRMRQEAPELLDRNVNHWFQSSPETRLVRTLDGNARAFLSDRYRPLDNYDLAQIALDALKGQGCQIVSCEMTERRMYLKATTDRISGEVSKGDIVQTGIVISNSEVGSGALRVEPLIYRLVCLNGMIAPDRSMKKHHIGRGGSSGEAFEGASEYFLDETRQADDRAFWMKVRDVINGVFSQEIFDGIVLKLREATTDVLEKPIKVVEVVSNHFGLTGDEQEGILSKMVSGGDTSRYGLLNAITAFSQEVSDYDRATDLERFGGQVLELPKSMFKISNN